MNKKEAEKNILNQSAAKALTAVRIRKKYDLSLYLFSIRPINIFAVHILI